jgi:transposase
MSDRNNPQRGVAGGTDSRYSLMEFIRECPDDAACLDMLWRERYASDGHHAECPKCERERKFHRIKSRPAYSCDTCGHSLYPLAGTIFHKSSTSLHLWFYAIYIMASTRCGVSAKHLERELGVTYKTAWRMFNLIRNKLMTEDKRPLTGYVEVDETSVDGKPRKKMDRWEAAKARERSRATVLAAVERGGRVKATVVPLAVGRT